MAAAAAASGGVLPPTAAAVKALLEARQMALSDALARECTLRRGVGRAG